MSSKFIVTDKWGEKSGEYQDVDSAIAAAKDYAGEEAYSEYVVYERVKSFMGKNRIEVEEVGEEQAP